MTCPRCASNQSDDVKFCTVCGANLHAVRQALDPNSEGKFNWNNTWLAEMFLSAQEHEKRKLALELAKGLTPEVKRYNEIKAGVITSSAGIAVSIFLYFLMKGIIMTNPRGDAEAILQYIWVAGVIPFFVGLALIVNGVFVSKKLVEIAQRQNEQNRVEGNTSPQALKSPDTNEFINTPFSVTEQTTKHLTTSDRK